jgi:hypothetical protein
VANKNLSSRIYAEANNKSMPVEKITRCLCFEHKQIFALSIQTSSTSNYCYSETREQTCRLKQRGSWDDSFEMLKGFKTTHGHDLVPQNYSADMAFGNWVHNQKQRWNKL